MKRCLWFVFGLGALILALLAVGVLPTAEASSGTKIDAIGQMGPYAVGFTSYVLTDNSRPGLDGNPGRLIPVYLWYPADPAAVNGASKAEYPIDMLNRPGLTIPSEEWEAMGYDAAYQEPPVSAGAPFPVLVISNGWTPPAWFLTGISTRLASHGFVVAVPYDVGDPQFFLWQPPGDHLAMAMWNRPRDASFVLTDLEQRNDAAGGLLSGAIDPSLVAAAGWSMYTPTVLAGGDDTVWDFGKPFDYSVLYGPTPDTVPHTPTLPDPRFKAIVLLGAANDMLKFSELVRVKVPSLILAEEWDSLVNINPVNPMYQSLHARSHAAFSGHPNYRVEITGINHMNFADTCTGLTLLEARGIPHIWDSFPWKTGICSPALPAAEARSIITRYMLAFLKTNLLGETGYQKMLTPGWALTHETAVEFFETEKRNPNSIYEEWPDYSSYFIHQPGSK
jgi:predicted dienelactone hydrolase